MKLIWLLLIVFSLSTLAEEKASTNENVETEIKKQLQEFYEKMNSGDEEIRKKALTDILPDEQTLKLLLTDEEVELIKEPMKMAVEKMVEANLEISKELTNGGKTLSIELRSLKEKHSDSKFLKNIKFPTYSAIIKKEKGSSGSSAYFLVNGKLKWLRGLENFDEQIEYVRKMKEKDKILK